MAAVALLKFKQGALIGPDGEALIVAPSVQVDIENSDNTDIQSWRLNLVYTPPGGGVAIALPLAENPASATPASNVTPDATPGCYRIQLIVYEGPSYTGDSDEDIRNFAVPDPVYGIVFPSYQVLPAKLPILGTGLPGEKPDELNFGGQPYGWDGEGTEGLLLQFMRDVVAGTIGGGGGGERRRTVIDIVDNTVAPPTEVADDRYILDFTAGGVHGDWDGASPGDIVEFDGATWQAETPEEGWVCLVDAKNRDMIYVDDGTPKWELRPLIGGWGWSQINEDEVIPEGRRLVFSKDLLVEDGSLLPEGEVISNDTVENHIITRVPTRASHTIPLYQTMFYLDDTVVDGQLTVDGQFAPIPLPPGIDEIPIDVLQDALEDIMPVGTILGRLSPPQGLTPTQVRTLINVEDGAQANVPEWTVAPGYNLDPTGLSLVAGNFYVVKVDNPGSSANLPASTSNGDAVGILLQWGAGSPLGSLTVNAIGTSGIWVPSPGNALSAAVNLKDTAVYIFRYESPSDTWRMESPPQFHGLPIPSVPVADSNGHMQGVYLANNSLLGRKSGEATRVDVSTYSLVGRPATGDIGGVFFGNDSFCGRSGAGSVTALDVQANEIVCNLGGLQGRERYYIEHILQQSGNDLIQTGSGIQDGWNPGGSSAWYRSYFVELRPTSWTGFVIRGLLWPISSSDAVYDKIIWNGSSQYNVVFEHNSAAFQAYGILCPDATEFVLGPYECCRITYAPEAESGSGRWVIQSLSSNNKSYTMSGYGTPDNSFPTATGSIPGWIRSEIIRFISGALVINGAKTKYDAGGGYGPIAKRWRVLINDSPSGDITLTHNSGLASSTERIYTDTGKDIVLARYDMAVLVRNASAVFGWYAAKIKTKLEDLDPSGPLDDGEFLKRDDSTGTNTDGGYPQSYVFGCSGAPSDGEYLVPGFGPINTNEIKISFPKGFRARSMRVWSRVAPGGIVNDTYTLRKNGATTFQVVLGPAELEDQLDGLVSFSAGDDASILFNTDGATAAQDITVVLYGD
jgi:hypothetical protein